MNVKGTQRLLVCYIPGLDFRRVNEEHTPAISRFLGTYPWTRIRTIPEVELLPTLLTGVYPHEHGIGHVKLKAAQEASPLSILTDRIPDIVTTSCQCLAHLFTGSFDLAAIPSKRRRRFEIRRFKLVPRDVNWLLSINGTETLFSAVERAKSAYVLCDRHDKLPGMLPKLCSQNHELEMLEMHSLDYLSHWNLDRGGRMARLHQEVDLFVKELHSKCQQTGFTLMILSDHGQEQVIGSIDLVGKMRTLSLSQDEYTYFLEVPKARFWFHTDRARRESLDLLSHIDHGTILSYQDMHRYNVQFDDDRFGEVYFIAEPGYIFFPHDFYHPLANLYLGLANWQHRSRIRNPKHRGCHGYLPEHESQKGFMVVLDDQLEVRAPEIHIIDVAPTILRLLGKNTPDSMKGTSALVAAQA